MPKVKPPTICQSGTQFAIKKHGVVQISRTEAIYAPTTLCGRTVVKATNRKFDPTAEESCGRCVLTFNKRYAA